MAETAATPATTPTTRSGTASRPSSATKEPVALATTKRKFHKILESLSSAAPSTKLSTNESAAKRIRIEARARLAAPSTLNSKESTIQAQLLSSRLSAARPKPATSPNSAHFADASSSTAPLPEANSKYTPWSHAHFLARLQTFADLRLWTSKPDGVNEVDWAKRGWICVDINTVACKGGGGCEQRVVVALRPTRKDADGNVIEGSEDYSVEVSDDVVRRFAQRIKDGHDEGCLWYGGGCKNDVYKLPIARPEHWQPALQARYTSFSKLPASDLPRPERLTHPLDMRKMQRSLLNILPELKEGDDTALAFSLTGWTLSPSSSHGYSVATCEVCFRRLGLWLYTTSAGGESSSAVEGMKIDLLANHRDYCPWFNAASQCAAGAFAGLAGWQILQRVVSNYAAFEREGEGLPNEHREIFSKAPGNDEGRDLSAGNTENTATATSNIVDGSNEAITSPATTIAINGGTSISNKQDREKTDQARFARLKELTKSMGLKTLRNKLTYASGQKHSKNS